VWPYGWLLWSRKRNVKFNRIRGILWQRICCFESVLFQWVRYNKQTYLAVWDLRFARQWILILHYSGMWRYNTGTYGRFRGSCYLCLQLWTLKSQCFQMRGTRIHNSMASATTEQWQQAVVTVLNTQACLQGRKSCRKYHFTANIQRVVN